MTTLGYIMKQTHACEDSQEHGCVGNTDTTNSVAVGSVAFHQGK